MAYEWLYQHTDSRKSQDAAHSQVTEELAAQFPAYLQSLGLKTADGVLLTADNYLTFIKQEIIRAAQIAKDAGAEIPDSLGFTFSEEAGGAPPVNGGATGMKPTDIPADVVRMMGNRKKRAGEYILDLDMIKYLNYITTKTALKTAPAFDSKDVAGNKASGENEEFGNEKGTSENFTAYSASKNGKTLSPEIQELVQLMNPMPQIGRQDVTVAPHWYIRHGAIDRDTSFPIPLNLAMKLKNSGKDVNYLLAWNRPHSGDYSLDELFSWIRAITQK